MQDKHRSYNACLNAALCLLIWITGFAVASELKIYTHEKREPTPLEKTYFETLKKQFPGEVLDANLETLHLLSDSEEYVQFLTEKYPEHAPFTTFQGFFYTVLPPKTRYFPFFKQQFGVETIEEIDTDELFLAHAFASGTWSFWGCKRGGDTSPPLRGLPSRFGIQLLITTPQGRKMLERRLGIERHRKTDIEDMGRILLTFRPLSYFGADQREEDVRWIKTLFEEHGPSEGMLWLAVQDPRLFDRILHTFSTDKTFLKSVFDPLELDIDKPRSKRRSPEKPNAN